MKLAPAAESTKAKVCGPSDHFPDGGDRRLSGGRGRYNKHISYSFIPSLLPTVRCTLAASELYGVQAWVCCLGEGRFANTPGPPLEGLRQFPYGQFAFELVERPS